MLDILNTITVMTGSSGSASGGLSANDTTALIAQVVFFGIVILFFYFVLIRPQKKKDKETKEMRASIQIGDEITTVGGIVGIVVRKSEDTVVIETGGDRSKLRVKLWAVQENATVHEMVESVQKSKKERKKEELEEQE